MIKTIRHRLRGRSKLVLSLSVVPIAILLFAFRSFIFESTDTRNMARLYKEAQKFYFSQAKALGVDAQVQDLSKTCYIAADPRHGDVSGHQVCQITVNKSYPVPRDLKPLLDKLESSAKQNGYETSGSVANEGNGGGFVFFADWNPKSKNGSCDLIASDDSYLNPLWQYALTCQADSRTMPKGYKHISTFWHD